MLSVKRHRLFKDGAGVPFKQTKHQSSGNIKPKYIVLHDTAGRLDFDGSFHYLANNDRNVSAHLVVGRDGEIGQTGAFNRKLWHAGKSSWRGDVRLNDCSIGIEMVNLGKCKEQAEGCYKPWFNAVFKDRNGLEFEQASTELHGSGWWLDYTTEQVLAVEEICEALVAAYTTIIDIVGHWQVSPGRKVDPNPLFPLASVKARAFGRDDREPGSFALVNTRICEWPSRSSVAVEAVSVGQELTPIRSGTYSHDGGPETFWLVRTDSHEGWLPASDIQL